MSEEVLDYRGLACPNPVLRTKEITDRGNVARLSILVDNPAAKENVSRFLSRMGYEITLSEEVGAFKVTGKEYRMGGVRFDGFRKSFFVRRRGD